jgi:hypothetical protein
MLLGQTVRDGFELASDFAIATRTQAVTQHVHKCCTHTLRKCASSARTTPGPQRRGAACCDPLSLLRRTVRRARICPWQARPYVRALVGAVITTWGRIEDFGRFLSCSTCAAPLFVYRCTHAHGITWIYCSARSSLRLSRLQVARQHWRI